jgi:hypothetical protein
MLHKQHFRGQDSRLLVHILFPVEGIHARTWPGTRRPTSSQRPTTVGVQCLYTVLPVLKLIPEIWYKAKQAQQSAEYPITTTSWHQCFRNDWYLAAMLLPLWLFEFSSAARDMSLAGYGYYLE